ncbi:MAG TPA: hypothetical protein DHV48_10625 [Prolixibacteraceae bacterium]|nr:hypothetical protein [Prolixibacteraceae bacterium]
MKNYLVIATLLLVSMGCTQKLSEADKVGVEAAIKGFYSALEKFDYAQMKTFCAPDFSGYENGKTSNSIDDFIAEAKQYEGSSIQFTIDFVKSDVGTDLAHSVVRFDAHFKNEKMQMDLKTFENYFLKKIDGKWLISFYQSSYLPYENDKKYTSIHLLTIPEKMPFDVLNESITRLNATISKIGYPDCGYAFMEMVPDKNSKFNKILVGNWRNADVYKIIHEDQEYKDAASQNEKGLNPYFINDVYVKYSLP